MNTSKTVRLYYVPQTFPCGENSTCCGPTGQSEEELQQYRSAIEQALPGVTVETVNVDKTSGGRLNMGRDMAVIQLLNNFGYAACPIFAVGSEVVSIGQPALPELIEMLRERIATAPTSS